MPRPDALRVVDGAVNQRLVVAVKPRQARARGLVEGDAELHARIRVHNRFVDIFYRLDKVTLPEDDVGIGGKIDGNIE